jgi:hypothetical protein
MSQSAGRFLAFPEPRGVEPDVGRWTLDVGRWCPLHPEVRVPVGDDVRRRSPLATPRLSPSGLSLIPLEVRSSEAGRTTVVGEVQRLK